jgi:hypothetical protein
MEGGKVENSDGKRVQSLGLSSGAVVVKTPSCHVTLRIPEKIKLWFVRVIYVVKIALNLIKERNSP